MLYSMTGFGSAVCKEESISVFIELKTVNSRYFKLSLRLTDGYGAMEQRVESLLRSTIERGTINANVRIISAKEESGFQINTAVLESYMQQLSDAAKSFKTRYGVFASFALERLALLPGVVITESDTSESDSEESDSEKVWTLLEKTLREALDALQAMRKTEGESMAKDLTANLESLRQFISKITELSPRVAPLYRQKLKERIEKVMAEQGLSLGTAPTTTAPTTTAPTTTAPTTTAPTATVPTTIVLTTDGDFVRELAVYADRCDISEEIVRFQSHLEQFTSAMRSQKCCGRKLDFLTQELFREANTIGSKANDAEITKHVVEIKTVIERIREMVQNVE